MFRPVFDVYSVNHYRFYTCNMNIPTVFIEFLESFLFFSYVEFS
eukprot:UN15744